MTVRVRETTGQVQLKVLVNHPPVIESLTGDPMTVIQNTSAAIKCVASDPDSDNLTYAWSATEGTFEGEGPAVSWLATSSCSVQTVTVTVSDGRGGTAKKSLNLTVKKPGG